MNSAVSASFENLQRQKKAAMSELAKWSGERLRFRPGKASWSALDVMDHVVKVERGLIESAQKSLPDGHTVVLKERIGAWMVMIVMKSPVRIKVPASASIVLPGKPVELTALGKKWDRTREEMAELLRSLSRTQLERGLFKHPVSGWMTMQHALGFLSAHLQHHGYQLRRLKKAASGV